jgi:hypothetical protein
VRRIAEALSAAQVVDGIDALLVLRDGAGLRASTDSVVTTPSGDRG